nr:T9SS type A sorting domain-containing protein [Bacteroidota bacterium]
MKKSLLTLLISIAFLQSKAQVCQIDCFEQTDSISQNVTNLLLNGSFESTTCAPFSVGWNVYCPNSAAYNCDVLNWTCTGGGTSSYPLIFSAASSIIADGLYGAYMGNAFSENCGAVAGDTSCLVDNNCEVTGLPPGFPNNGSAYGGNTGVSIEQTVTGLIPGNIYVLEFWTGGEGFNSYPNRGLFGLDVGFGYNYLRCKGTTAGSSDVGIRYVVQFMTNSTSHTIKFTNWGHICSSCTEVMVDHVRLYTQAQLSPLISPCGGVGAAPVVNIASSDTIWCDKQAIDFTDLSTNMPTSWMWYFTGATPSTSTDQNPVGIYYPSQGAFSVTLVACNAIGCDSVTFVNFVQEFPSPVPPVVSVINDSLCVSGYVTYQWFETGNLTNVLSTNSCFVPTVAGNYFVLVTDTNGCEVASGTVPVTVSIYEQDALSKIKMIPNPFDDITSLEFTIDDVHNTAISIVDVTGREVMTVDSKNFQPGKNKLQLNLSLLNDGVYFCKVSMQNKVMMVKLMKR